MLKFLHFWHLLAFFGKMLPHYLLNSFEYHFASSIDHFTHSLLSILLIINKHRRTNIPKMSYMLPHLKTAWAVDQAILNEEEKVVIIRFGHDWDSVSIHNFYYFFLLFQLVTTLQ